MFIDKGMDKEDVVHIYKGIILSHKRNEILPFAKTWMDLKTVIQRDIYIYIYISYNIAYMCNLEKLYR